MLPIIEDMTRLLIEKSRKRGRGYWKSVLMKHVDDPLNE